MGVPVRVQSVAALSDFYGPEVSASLAQALEDPHPAVRHAAVRGIAALGVPAAADSLVRCVVSWDNSGDTEATDFALETLTRWRVEGVSEVFVETLMADGAPDLETRHRDAFAKLLESDPRGDLSAEAVAGRLIAVLRTPGGDDRLTRAQEVLSWVGPAGAGVVIAAIESGEATPEVVRSAAALRDAGAVDPLVRLLADGDGEMRRSAANALQGLNDTRAVPALVAATQDPDQSVRDAASAALNGMGMAAVIVGLATILRAHDPALESGDQGPGLLGEAGWSDEVVNRLLRRGESTSRG